MRGRSYIPCSTLENMRRFWVCRRQCGSNAALRHFDRRLEAFGSRSGRRAKGLEPAACCVTGRRSDQLNYVLTPFSYG